MKDFKLTLSSLGYFIQEITKALTATNKTYRVSICEWKEKRSLSQNSFSHCIYSDLSKYLIKNGRTDCSPAWIKKMLKNKFLGWKPETFVDVVTGKKKDIEVLRKTSELDTGEMTHYITQILAWAESIGCDIKIPDDCEYMKLIKKQER